MAAQQFHDVTVIGAGWSGLVATKYMREEGLSVVCIEKRADIGGTWLYSDDPNILTVMKSTCCTSSSTVTEMSDFPMPQKIGSFPHQKDVLQYLRDYTEKFGLMPSIRLNTEVMAVEKNNQLWYTTCSNGTIYTSKYLVVAPGMRTPNRELEETLLKDFTGDVYHACEIKAPIEKHRGQRLLVLGGGETASDICTEWRDLVEFTYWSIPRGQHFFRKYAKVVPWGKPQALDKASSRLMKAIAPYHRGKPGLTWICKWTSNGSLLAYQGHGIQEWKNDSPYFHFYFNKSGKVLDLVDYQYLVPKGTVTKCEGKQVTFIDGTTQEFDVIITSTGYKAEFPYLPKRYADVKIRARHKFVFDVEDPSIAFVGFARPVVGAITNLTNIQVRWVARVFSGRAPLLSVEERRTEVKKDTAFWQDYFKETSQRVGGLVEGFTYGDSVAKLGGFYPDYWSLLKSNPKQWFTAISSPYNGATFHLNEPDKREQAIATMMTHKKGTLTPIHLLLILFLRLIWFDWWLVQLSKVKYGVQSSRWWPSIRDTRTVQAIDRAWTYPKRVLFDDKSDARTEMLSQSDEKKEQVRTTNEQTNTENGHT